MNPSIGLPHLTVELHFLNDISKDICLFLIVYIDKNRIRSKHSCILLCVFDFIVFQQFSTISELLDWMFVVGEDISSEKPVHNQLPIDTVIPYFIHPPQTD